MSQYLTDATALSSKGQVALPNPAEFHGAVHAAYAQAPKTASETDASPAYASDGEVLAASSLLMAKYDNAYKELAK